MASDSEATRKGRQEAMRTFSLSACLLASLSPGLRHLARLLLPLQALPRRLVLPAMRRPACSAHG